VRATEIYLPRHKHNRKILDSVAGIAFLGTPFGGSWETGYLVANLRLEMAADAATEYNRELIDYLRPGTRDAPSPLQDLIERFTYMIRQKDFNFGIICFYETRDTDFSPYKNKLSPSYAGHLNENGHGIVSQTLVSLIRLINQIESRSSRKLPPASKASTKSPSTSGIICCTNSTLRRMRDSST
jgi:hypothetical protein